MKMKATFFKRKEKKFIVGPEVFLKLKDLINDPNQNFKTDHLDKDTEFTYIENIYFDTPDLLSYHQSLNGAETRFKLRIRSYSQNHIRDDDRIFFEVKSKENGETLKKRVAFKSAWLDAFLKDGSYPQGDFVLLNLDKKPSKSLKIIGYISSLIQEQNFRPVLDSSYVRLAFRIDGSDSIRITIDRDLKFRSLINEIPVNLPYSEQLNPGQVVVEVKYLDEEKLLKIPGFMTLLGETNKFSKYCYGIFQGHLEGQAAMESTLKIALPKEKPSIFAIPIRALR